jgi:hypothetical protein
MKGSPVWWVAVGFLLALVPRAAAEEKPGRWYVLGGVAGVYSQGVEDGESVLTALSPGGATLGWQVAGGLFVRPHVSVEVELSRTGVLKAREPGRYGMRYHEVRRDQFFALNVRLHIRAGRHADLEPVVGVGVLRQAGESQIEYGPWGTHPVGFWGPRVVPDPWTDASASAGIDVRLGGRRFAVVPSVKVRATLRGSRYDDWWGEPTARFTAAAGVFGQVSF